MEADCNIWMDNGFDFVVAVRFKGVEWHGQKFRRSLIPSAHLCSDKVPIATFSPECPTVPVVANAPFFVTLVTIIESALGLCG